MSSSKSRGGGSSRWTTDEQLKYLQSQKEDYHTAQVSGGKKFSDFWMRIFEYYFAHWPLGDLTEEEKSTGLTKSKKSDAIKSVSKRFTFLNIQLTHLVSIRGSDSGIIIIPAPQLQAVIDVERSLTLVGSLNGCLPIGRYIRLCTTSRS
jgi:hypothetical protein